MTDSSAPRVYPTALGASDLKSITLLGHDLAEDIMGSVGFGELAFWLATQRRPSRGETRVFEAVLAALADHGFTPTAIVTRLTYLSAPDSVQGALAAGLLGGGSRFLGVTEDTGKFLHETITAQEALPGDDAGWDELALRLVREQRAAGRFVPGLGHHVHKEGDPRAPRLMGIAAEEGLFGPHLSLFAAIGRVHPQVLGKTLPLNGAGVCGAALADLRLPLPLLRGFALLARTAGLIGQLAEEMCNPVANDIFLSVDLNNRSIAPQPDTNGGSHG
ncbi:citryl-CoA lyase [Streptomyces sp. NBC_01217]|uniref:citryl-CoA lyase n=1 Tax=Streptomyces sp. NBC_01217 TaxID=2903779 RepID=UPI002E0F1E65|nr:citryl-CoA lyase [Streptomyces sp. NBC_01217]